MTATTDSRVWTLTFPPPAPWLNANQRYKRRPTETIRAWRQATLVWAKAAKLPKGLRKAHILVELRFADQRRRDAGNLYPTVKACVDGLIDYGLLPDDSHQYLDGPDLRIGPPIARRRVGVSGELHFTITDLTGETHA